MEKKLGLSALTALVLSSMLGAGVFSLPQNMAAVASPSALLIGWAITGVGILFLAFAMLLLTRIRPDLDGGIFTYAREGFGELIGFCSAWGYWLCAVIANVSYLVIVFSALSFFTDTPELRLFGDGNTWQSIVGASVLLWVVHFLVLRGVQTAAGINLVATLAKLLPLGAFVALAALAFQLDTFRLDFSGLALGVPVWEQVKNTMLITLWVFIGVEGAVVVSARARHKRDVGRATLLAVLSALAVYLLVTLLSLGVVPRSELAEMRNPSMAGLMVRLMGSWGEIVIAAGLIVSVCGAYLSWTIMAAEVPFLAATHKAFPRLFARQNSNNAPSASLWLTNMLNHALEALLRGHGHAASDIIHITDYVVERGSDKHIAYAASKAALDNMTRSFARKLAPEVKVNAIAPSLIMFNEGDDEAYRQQALDKSLMKIAPGEKEISDLIDYLFTSRYVTGRSFAVDGGRPLR
ncbi:TPA: amino acid permease [Klebsiella pneumoniae]|nr:amino acid permease [Klebsiella pneumoniae]